MLILAGGCLAGATFTLFFGNKLGRRRIILFGACWVVTGTIIQITPIPGRKPGYQFVIGPGGPNGYSQCGKGH
ncbi:hypothetical protein FISHEDRAFT_72044 [Fistulina hepatica ATCC 64428]|uniref:Major facilitator superfamily (MFS) profile domain-containing protein n=1 Tax=Fistulina hepatica ATCC 64428 TaxID=1128425 RepID=A0A0D7AGX7_9AGAR|nr:hypothetical protein FISHEDRAFT_72044 [Fistulina hepatica ATCC 64428]